MEALLLAFLPQRQALMYAKPMLFVDDHQRKAVKLHLFLEDGVRADDHLYLAAGNGLLLRLACFAFLLTRQPAHFHAERREPVAEIVGVLFSQQLGRRHQGHLIAVGNRPQCRQRRHQRFPGTHVALYKAHHRHIERHIAFNFCHHARLRAGRFERQRGQQGIFQRILRIQRLCVITLRPGTQRQHTEIVCQ